MRANGGVPLRQVAFAGQQQRVVEAQLLPAPTGLQGQGGSTGSGQAMSVLNPYHALYIWVRVDDAA